MTEPAVRPRPAPPAREAMPTVSLVDVTRLFGGRSVVGPVSLRLDAGAVAVVVGANGAGKTTLLRLAAGLLAPSGGTIRREGRAVYLRPGAGARNAVTVRRAVTDVAELTGTPAPATYALVEDVCQLTGLGGLAGARVGELSTGQQARLSAALAVAAAPALACLDEPTAHLDPDGVHHVLAAVRRLADAGAAVLVASHTPQAFADVADAVLALESGVLREPPC